MVSHYVHYVVQLYNMSRVYTHTNPDPIVGALSSSGPSSSGRAIITKRFPPRRFAHLFWVIYARTRSISDKLYMKKLREFRLGSEILDLWRRMLYDVRLEVIERVVALISGSWCLVLSTFGAKFDGLCNTIQRLFVICLGLGVYSIKGFII